MSNQLIDDAQAALKPVTAVYLFTSKGMALIEARVQGDFALHPTVVSEGGPIDMAGMEWSVTHIASGRNLAMAESEANAEKMIADLNSLGYDWAFRDSSVFRSWPGESTERVLAVIEKHGCTPPKAESRCMSSTARH